MASALFILNDKRIWENLLGHLQGLPLNGTWEILIREHKSKRTAQQNAYFHALRDLLADHLAYDKEELKQILKEKFIGKRKAVWDGCDIYYTPDTSSLPTKEFSELIVKTQELCSYFEIQYPLPSYYGVKI